MKNIFEIEPKTNIPIDSSYIISYPYILSYFSEITHFTIQDVVCGSHMIYGWMPTILKLHREPPYVDLNEVAEIFTSVKRQGRISNDDLSILVSYVNHSLVGVSKLLHFISPEKFAIWDSKIFSFVHEKKPYQYNVSNIEYYRNYLALVSGLATSIEFDQFNKSVNNKIGYDVSSLRAIELIMFLNSGQQSIK